VQANIKNIVLTANMVFCSLIRSHDII